MSLSEAASTLKIMAFGHLLSASETVRRTSSAAAAGRAARAGRATVATRSEEHTSELQSHSDLVCRLLLEKKTYAVPFLALAIWFLLYRSRFGLWLRAAGEQPGAADPSGVPVFLIRYLAVTAGGRLARLAG